MHLSPAGEQLLAAVRAVAEPLLAAGEIVPVSAVAVPPVGGHEHLLAHRDDTGSAKEVDAARALLVAELARRAERGELAAGAVIVDVEALDPRTQRSTAALLVALEERSGGAWDVYLPYRRNGKAVVFDEPFASARERTLFAATSAAGAPSPPSAAASVAPSRRTPTDAQLGSQPFLASAIARGDLVTMAAAVAAGADVNGVWAEHTPLRWALRARRRPAIDWLLDRGARLHAHHFRLWRELRAEEPELARLLVGRGALRVRWWFPIAAAVLDPLLRAAERASGELPRS